MKHNLMIGESLQVFKQKTWDHGTKTNKNYNLVMKYLIIHFFPPKALQRQKRYQRRGIYKPHGTKIREFIYRIDDMVEYLENFPPFVSNQDLPEDKILYMAEFSLPREFQKELIIQGFDSMTQGLTELVELC